MKVEIIKSSISTGQSKVFDVYSPSTKKIIYQVEEITQSDFEKVYNSVHQKQLLWKKIPLKRRISFIFKYIKLIEENQDRIINLIVKENGKLKSEAEAEVKKVIELAEFAVSIPNIIQLKTQEVSRGVEVRDIVDPVGVIGVITPFNFPIMVPHWNILNALVLGNGVIIKPSTQTPKTIQYMIELMNQAGLPKNLVEVVYGEKEVVQYIVKKEGIDAITFVGSSDVAALVYQQSTMYNKRCLALGSAKNNTIVTPDVDYEDVAEEIIASAFGMAGQRCMATSVVISVGENNKIINKIVEKIVDYPKLPPVINEKNKKNIELYLEKNKDRLVLNGLKKNGNIIDDNHLNPTIILHQNKSTISQEEIFGPVLEIISVSTFDEAIQLQNSFKYANGASIYTSSGIIASRANELSAGMIGINIGVPVPREPFGFGGAKLSKFGYGEITGSDSLGFYFNKKKITSKWNSQYKIDWMS